MWHDGSCISNHSHLLMTVNILYDIGIHYTDEEYYNETGKRVNVQAEVEKPQMYILARCSNDDHQLLYCQTRKEDVKMLKDPVEVT